MPHAVNFVGATGDYALKCREERKALGCKDKKQSLPSDRGRQGEVLIQISNCCVPASMGRTEKQHINCVN